MIERALRGVSRAGLFVFFRARDVAGLENVPAEGPVLLVSNHTNAFVDALVVAAAVRRRVTLTAKSTLFGQPVLRSILRGIGAIPMHRRQDRDQGADPSANVEALAECRRRLALGEALCIFPEGVSHSDPSLRPLRTGAARIALDFVQGESRSLAIVPVGLHYEAKERFRSAVSARFGEAIDTASWLERHPGAGARELTAEIETRLRALTVNARRRREAVLFRWTAEVLATRGLPPPVLGREHGAAADRAILSGLVGEGYEKLETAHREEIRGLEERVRRYHGGPAAPGHRAQRGLPRDERGPRGTLRDPRDRDTPGRLAAGLPRTGPARTGLRADSRPRRTLLLRPRPLGDQCGRLRERCCCRRAGRSSSRWPGRS